MVSLSIISGPAFLLVAPSIALSAQPNPPPTLSATEPVWARKYDTVESDAPILERLNYIQVDGGSLSLSGEVRLRYETFDEETINSISAPAKDDYMLYRALLGVVWQSEGKVRLFGQIGLHGVAGKSGPVLSIDKSGADVQQAFAEFSKNDLMVRVGRQELPLGAQRLVSVREVPNVRLSFDAVRVDYKNITAFISRPVRLGTGSWDDASNLDQSFSGLYARTKNLPFKGLKADIYVFRLTRRTATYAVGIDKEERYTLGMRIFDKSPAFDYDIETGIQRGTYGARDIKAAYLAADFGYTFDRPIQPRAGIIFDVTTGDRDLSDRELNTFNPLYPRISFFTEISRVGAANMVRLAPSLAVKPLASLKVQFGADVIWRYRVEDAVYRQPAIPVPNTAGHHGKYIGTQLWITPSWQLNRHFGISGILAHGSVGKALKGVGSGDSNYGAFALTYRF